MEGTVSPLIISAQTLYTGLTCEFGTITLSPSCEYETLERFMKTKKNRSLMKEPFKPHRHIVFKSGLEKLRFLHKVTMCKTKFSIRILTAILILVLFMWFLYLYLKLK